MKKSKDLTKLHRLAQLMLDQRLQELRLAVDARNQSLMQRDRLNAPIAETDLPPIPAGIVALAYQRWADDRRTELNGLIARQTADWIEKRSLAASAFGRADVLRKLATDKR